MNIKEELKRIFREGATLPTESNPNAETVGDKIESLFTQLLTEKREEIEELKEYSWIQTPGVVGSTKPPMDLEDMMFIRKQTIDQVLEILQPTNQKETT